MCSPFDVDYISHSPFQISDSDWLKMLQRLASEKYVGVYADHIGVLHWYKARHKQDVRMSAVVIGGFKYDAPISDPYYRLSKAESYAILLLKRAFKLRY